MNLGALFQTCHCFWFFPVISFSLSYFLFCLFPLKLWWHLKSLAPWRYRTGLLFIFFLFDCVCASEQHLNCFKNAFSPHIGPHIDLPNPRTGDRFFLNIFSQFVPVPVSEAIGYSADLWGATQEAIYSLCITLLLTVASRHSRFWLPR